MSNRFVDKVESINTLSTFDDKYKNTTMSLKYALEHCPSIEEFFKKRFDDLLDDNVLSKILLELSKKDEEKSLSFYSTKAGYDRTYLSSIINNKRRNPSRDSLISLAVTMGATLEEVECVLKCAGKQPLYARNKRDVVIWYSLKKGEDIDILNDNLIKFGFKPLYKNTP